MTLPPIDWPNLATTPPEELAQSVSERFVWCWQQTEIAGQPWKLAVATDPDAMLIEACERQDAGEQGVIDPFWATTWRAAAGLDRYLGQLNLHGADILELGCGTGHAGISAALRGAKVVLTDGVEDPLLLARMSSWPIRERCDVRQLRFGIDRIDSTRFPLIIGSDITYLRTLWPQLDRCLRTHLETDGQVLLSDPYRIIAREFRQWIQNHGWHCVEHQVPMDDEPDHPIRVMLLRAKR
jgi:predicted nicotinamide N-methyase